MLMINSVELETKMKQCTTWLSLLAVVARFGALSWAKITLSSVEQRRHQMIEGHCLLGADQPEGKISEVIMFNCDAHIW